MQHPTTINIFSYVVLLSTLVKDSDLALLNSNEDLVKFVKAAGWNRIDLISADQNILNKLINPTELYKEIHICFLSNRSHSHGNSSRIFLLSIRDPSSYWDNVACTKPHRCAAMMDERTWPIFKTHMEAFDKSRAFYSLVIGPTDLSMYRSQTFRDQNIFVLNKITLMRADNRFILHHDYDMSGAILTSMARDWRPYNRFFDCKHEWWGDCTQEGIFANVSQVLAKQFNFTIVANKEPHDNWGKDRCVGKMELGNWTEGQPFPNGVYGYLEHERMDMSLIAFRSILERENNFDLSIPVCSATRKIVFSLDRNTNLDFTMFFRPFARLSWSFFTLTLAVFVILACIFNMIDSKAEKRFSYQILMLTIWLMFVLLNAFYGGALTMFYSTPPSIPFNNLQEVIKLYPTWKLFIIDETWTYLLSQGVPEEFIDKILNDEQSQVKDLKAAIDKVSSEPGTYFCPTDIRLNSYFSEHSLPKSR